MLVIKNSDNTGKYLEQNQLFWRKSGLFQYILFMIVGHANLKNGRIYIPWFPFCIFSFAKNLCWGWKCKCRMKMSNKWKCRWNNSQRFLCFNDLHLKLYNEKYIGTTLSYFSVSPLALSHFAIVIGIRAHLFHKLKIFNNLSQNKIQPTCF